MKKLYLSFLTAVIFFFAQGQSTTLTISQVYGGAGCGTANCSAYKNDFIEIFNKSSSPINVNGYSVQYTSAAGTAWTATNLPNVTLQPGQYLLVAEAFSANGTTALPTPDVTGAIAMSATAGKVALVNTTTLLTGSQCTRSGTVIDFVGYGATAVCNETTFAPAPSTANSIFRASNGCQDQDNNGSDFAAAPAAPRNTASPFSPCAPTCTTPTQKATDMRYGGSGSTSMNIYFSRGNGLGSLVLCRQGSPVNAAPVNGTVYTANSIFGLGSNVGGTGNYAVFNTSFPGVNAFTVNNLTAGTKYYFSVFEYNDPNKCYTATGLVDSFIVGGTLLKPGDMVFVGWDNSIVGGGDDKVYLMNMVDIARGTQFSITNSRFEAGAAANVRTNRWYGGSTDPYQDPEKQDFEYVGASPIAKGSVIAMESSASGFTNFTINGVSVPASDFSAKSGFSNFISNTGTDADQLYITQGRFTPYGTAGVDRYNLYNGLVIHGISIRTPWIPLSSAVSSANTGGGTRQSRIPPDILCINTEFGTSSFGYGVYNRAMGTTGTKSQLLSSMRNMANWNTGTGSGTADDALASQPNVNNTYTVNSPVQDGVWLGGSSSDWFDCSNWEGLHVPDSTTIAYVNTGVPNNADISVSASTKAVEFKNMAHAGTLFITAAGVVSLVGAGADKLEVEDGIYIDATGTLQFENNSNAAGDTLWVHQTITDNHPLNTVLGFQPGQGTVVLAEARTNLTPYTLNKNPINALKFYKLAVNNTRNISTTDPVRVTNNLNLQNGYLVVPSTASLTLSSTATVSSPANVYGLSNRGYFNSFVSGKMYYDADAASVNMIFPIGKYNIGDTLFAPVELTKTDATVCTYDAEYFPVAYSDLTVDPAQLHHVSRKEHWLINSSVIPASAKVTLSWRPMSQVGDGSNNPVAFDSLMVSHYFDDDGAGGNPSLWHVDGGSNVIMPKNAGYNFNYGMLTTVASTGSFSPFTLGTRGNYNILPLKLLDFTAVLKGEIVHLQWLTEEETAMDKYIVERSADGIHFSPIASVNALNNPGRLTYLSYDLKPLSGNNYYRLRIADRSGKINYSLIVPVWVGKEADFQVFPNPARDHIQINLPTGSSNTAISIVNSCGQVVKQLTTKDQSVVINIESLSRGVYFIKIFNNRQTIAQKFTKMQ